MAATSHSSSQRSPSAFLYSLRSCAWLIGWGQPLCGHAVLAHYRDTLEGMY